MAKGIIVVEIPANCLDCPIGENVSNLLEACVICQMAPKEVNPCRIDSEIEKRPDWCPIRPMPDRKEVMGSVKYRTIDFINRGRQSGWNECVDYLEGRNGE